MKLLGSLRTLGIQEKIASTQIARITAHVPSRVDCAEPGCGPDPVFGGAKDASCSVCGGSGYVTTWVVSYLSASRIMWVDAARARFTRSGIVVTGEIGDVQMQCQLKDESLLGKVKANPSAYLLVDNKRVRPESVTRNRVLGPTSLDVRCFLVKDE